MRGVTPEANVGDFPASDGYTLSRADPMRHARCSSPFYLALAIGLTLSAPIASAQGGRRGPPKTGSFQTDVPPIALNAILARPTSTAVTLSLLSAADRDVVVVLEGEAPRRLPQHLRAGEPASVELTGLVADRAYRYHIEGAEPLLAGSFRTARRPGAGFRFVLQADSHLDERSDTRIYATALGNMRADSADFLIDLGDTFMSEKYPDFRTASAQYYAQRSYFGLVGNTLPVFLVQGNHDGELGWTAANASWAAAMRTRYFPPVLANDFYVSAPSAKNYYAWQWGDAAFLVLDPFVATTDRPNRAGTSWAWTLGKEQYDWLVRTLDRSTARYTFVFLHHLVGGTGYEARGGAEASRFFEWGGANLDGSPGFAARRPGWALPIHDLLLKYHVTAVFHGHDHLYVRQERDGIAYQEVPQPSLAREGGINSAEEYGYRSGTLFGSPGHVRVTVDSTRAVVEFVRSRLSTGNGGIVDRYELKPRPR